VEFRSLDAAPAAADCGGAAAAAAAATDGDSGGGEELRGGDDDEEPGGQAELAAAADICRGRVLSDLGRGAAAVAALRRAARCAEELAADAGGEEGRAAAEKLVLRAWVRAVPSMRAGRCRVYSQA
jgi:hypothetical protein